MSLLQKACAEYELSKYAHAFCGLNSYLSTYNLCRYLQLFHGDEALLFAGDAAFRGSLNDRVELTIVRLGI